MITIKNYNPQIFSLMRMLKNNSNTYQIKNIKSNIYDIILFKGLG